MGSEATTTDLQRTKAHRVREFDPNVFDWEEWEILFETFLAVENVENESQKRNLLITSLGVQAFKTVISICKPQKPTECKYDVLLEKLRSNYARISFASTERIKFFASRQASGSTLTVFANELRDKATDCDFPADFYEQALITAFVGGLNNDQVRKYLMQRDLRSFEETLNSAKTIDSVLIEGTRINSSTVDDSTVNHIKVRRRPDDTGKKKVNCASCGSGDHIRDDCRFRGVTCHKCKKIGHIARVCRSPSTFRSEMVNSVVLKIDECSPSDEPIEVQVMVNGCNVALHFDTGSPVTLITEHMAINWTTIAPGMFN